MSGRSSLRKFAAQYAKTQTTAPVKPPTVTGERFRKRRNLEAEFALMLHAHGIGGFIMQHRFHPIRKWLFDFAWQQARFAVEIDGGVFKAQRTGHTTQSGIRRDYEKDTQAFLLGWRVFRITDEMVQQQITIDVVRMYVGDGSAETRTAEQSALTIEGGK